jgi:hypothetical protein
MGRSTIAASDFPVGEVRQAVDRYRADPMNHE